VKPIIALFLFISLLCPAASHSETQPWSLDIYQGKTLQVERGSFQVPENRSNKNTRSLTLFYVRLPALTNKPGNPIVYLAGGPGGSATEAAQWPRMALFQALRQQADVILFDQRGTGLSDQLNDCQADPTPLFMAPLTIDLLDQFYANALPRCLKQWENYDLDGYSTPESAADLVALANALGTKKLDLLAISYGTHLAMATAKYHSEILGKLVLASSEGLDQTIKLPRESETLLQQLEQRWQTAEGHQQSLISLMQRVHQQLAKTPVTVMMKHPLADEKIPVIVSELDVQLISSWMLLKNPTDQAKLPAFYQTMAAGEFHQAAAYAMQIKASFGQMNPMALAMDAKSGISAARWQQVLEQARTSTLGRSTNLPFPDIIKSLNVKPLTDKFRMPLTSKLPALFLMGAQDGRTFIADQQQNARQFKRSKSIVINGGGHDSFLQHPEVADRILQFLGDQPINLEPIEIPLPPFIRY
jgi:pimeloyl-ACP methyl ester carboxylesterase